MTIKSRDKILILEKKQALLNNVNTKAIGADFHLLYVFILKRVNFEWVENGRWFSYVLQLSLRMGGLFKREEEIFFLNSE